MSLLRFFTRHVTAGDLQCPFGPTLSPGQAAGDALEEVTGREFAIWRRLNNNPFESICLVAGPDEDPRWFVWPEELTDGLVSDVATPLLAEYCIAANTPAMQLTRVFAERGRPWAIVLSGDRVTGYVTWGSLSRPEFSVCVFALLLEVEQQCAEALANAADPKLAWRRLTPNRAGKAMQVFADRFKRPPSEATTEELIFCTTFADKAAMLPALPEFTSVPMKQLRSEFKAMERVRNILAHTGLNVHLWLSELGSVIEAAEANLKRLNATGRPDIRLVEPASGPR